MIVVRTKIKQTEEDVRQFEDKRSVYPKILELPEREPKKRGRPVKYDPLTKSFDSYMESVQQ